MNRQPKLMYCINQWFSYYSESEHNQLGNNELLVKTNRKPLSLVSTYLRLLISWLLHTPLLTNKFGQPQAVCYNQVSLYSSTPQKELSVKFDIFCILSSQFIGFFAKHLSKLLYWKYRLMCSFSYCDQFLSIPKWSH
jgi:hypothetical protein